MTPRQTPFLCLRFGDWSSSAKSWFLCVRAPGALGEVDLLLKSIDSKTVRRPSLKRAAGGWHFGSSIPFASPSPPVAASCHNSARPFFLPHAASPFCGGLHFLIFVSLFCFSESLPRKLTCFIAVSLCPWWFVTNINRQTSSVYTLNTVELLPKESSRSPL